MSLFAFRTLCTLALGLAAALLCVWLRTPIPWMIGPLLAVSVVSALGAPTRMWVPLRNTGQWGLGAALGLYFTPPVLGLIAGLWWTVLLGIVWSLLSGAAVGWWLYRRSATLLADVPARKRWATCFFAGSVAGANEMTMQAERAGGRTDLVAAAHSLRVLMVTSLVPFAFALSGMHGADSEFQGVRNFDLLGLGLLTVLTLMGAWVMRKLGRNNPWFMGALLASMIVTMTGTELSSIPTWMTNAAQLLMGVNLGTRFRPEFLHAAPRWMADVAVATLALIITSVGFGWLLALGTTLHPATVMLGMVPGGIAEMAITAKAMQVGVPFVTTLQVCRVVAVLFLAGPIFQRFAPPPEAVDVKA